MRELTENEKLARLVRSSNQEAEEFDSADMLTKSLMSQLSVNPAILAQVKQEIIASGAEMEYTPLSSFSANGRKVVSQPSEPTKDTKLIGVLQVVYQGMVDVFERSGINSTTEKNMITLIDAIGACLNYLGEPTGKFEPLVHLSGLQAPNMVKNASKVLETTLSCYKIGTISDSSISDDGSKINIVFSGKSKGVEYSAFGVVSAASWEGSEAIDYIYTPGSGKMSIKSYENGKWVDRSNNKNYVIRWELEEKDTNLKESEKEKTNNSTVKELKPNISQKNSNNKKEVAVLASNNIDDDEEIGFPIDDGYTVEDSDI